MALAVDAYYLWWLIEKSWKLIQFISGPAQGAAESIWEPQQGLNTVELSLQPWTGRLWHQEGGRAELHLDPTEIDHAAGRAVVRITRLRHGPIELHLQTQGK